MAGLVRTVRRQRSRKTRAVCAVSFRDSMSSALCTAEGVSLADPAGIEGFGAACLPPDFAMARCSPRERSARSLDRGDLVKTSEFGRSCVRGTPPLILFGDDPSLSPQSTSDLVRFTPSLPLSNLFLTLSSTSAFLSGLAASVLSLLRSSRNFRSSSRQTSSLARRCALVCLRHGECTRSSCAGSWPHSWR
jgi:hypothetical protein